MGDPYDDPAVGSPEGGIDRLDGSSVLDLQSILAVLDHPRRRVLLELVTDLDSATTRDLATQIAAHENDVRPHEVTDAERRTVTVALYHVHIPKLVDTGVIETDKGMDRIVPGQYADQVLAAMRGLYSEFDVDIQFATVESS